MLVSDSGVLDGLGAGSDSVDIAASDGLVVPASVEGFSTVAVLSKTPVSPPTVPASPLTPSGSAT